MTDDPQEHPSWDCGQRRGEPWPRENLPTGAGPWRRTKLIAVDGGGHETAVYGIVPTRQRVYQLGRLRQADPQLLLAPLQAMLALLRATWTPLQTRRRLLQTTRGTTPAGESWLMLAPFRTMVTPLQTIWRLLQATVMPLQAR
jgi:hypothetical protein